MVYPQHSSTRAARDTGRRGRKLVLLLEEPSAGVDSRTVTVLWDQIRAVHEQRVTTLLMEQNARQALAMSDRGYVLDFGEVSFEGLSRDLLADAHIAELYVGG